MLPRADLEDVAYLPISSIWLSPSPRRSPSGCARRRRARASAGPLADALKAVRRAARLERAAAQDLGAGTLDRRPRVAMTCSSVSAEQGRPSTITSSPPMRTSSSDDDRVVGLNVRLARL
jgi:hypothetical protein